MNYQPTILVIDDDPDNFDVIETLLCHENYHFNYASSGIKALDRLDTIAPDIILLDVMMPDMNGIEVCRRIKTNPNWRHIPIIMVTALSSKEDLARCLDTGADDFLSKPVNGIELRARIRSLLRIKQQYDALQASLQIRQDMSNMIVHDLRNPLTSIMLSCEMLKLTDLAELQQKKIKQIGIASKHLESLIDSLLIMAKLEAGHMLLNLTDVDLITMTEMVVSDIQPMASQRRIELISHLPDSQKFIKLDSSLFRRVLDNLLMNAIKFSPKDSKIVVEIDYPSHIDAIIRVIDRGPGVSQELKQRIFDKYEVGSFFADVKQTGLGLAFCKMAVEAHGGTIYISDNQPRGSIFTVEISS
ncbi:MAG TPA: hybrid sensor histidine kinase/response regulator [Cyanobacteria bacterium UBA11149]|nr:hybrid sensor histidine kinase/response regulator [Cyanobacteria bacterium UBA11367]HBE60542.1 hybrid sensor histidine kinase/response regulator [Cyanobacteria bacterium UBA11366]HBK63772.1 hybrid sensor histidine kinase/response regulator [Cyanobacteria bacterium UBA11166]HBR72878.1 hybrid sensor histidine kinase/response regulator [Cyanobacteria bacterium UBA11159]HBS68991.1 hybrid sensor histidine kinase/response regulator [Cyanobacteria bacterium UBA11153]HBW89604.1 hybrid sensor histid